MKFLIESVNHDIEDSFMRDSFEHKYPELTKLCNKESNIYYSIEIDTLDDLQKVYKLTQDDSFGWHNRLIIDFDNKTITIYDGYIE